MSGSGVLHWLAGSELSHLASHTRWVFATAQAAHFMGLSMLLGSVAILDLRILGLFRPVPIERFFAVIPLALTGFAVQVFTGIVMFSAEPSRYWSNPGFRIKIALIGIAGVNALWFWAMEHQDLSQLVDDRTTPWSAKLVAAGSLAVWILVITFGRFLPYLDGIDLSWVPGAASQ